MFRTLILSLLAFSGGSLMASVVDLTPLPYELELDGVIFHQVKFRHGTQEITYRPPGGWHITGNPQSASLQASPDSTIRAEIAHQENTPAPAFDEDGLKALRARAQALVPQVEDLKLISEVKNPLRINGYDTVDYTFAGTLFARKYKFFVLLLPMGNERFSFVLRADEKEFENGAGLFLSSLFRLNWSNPHSQ